jgi:hypothetical protein
MRRISIALLLLALFLPIQTAFAQVERVKTELSSVFGTSITFRSEVTSSIPIKAAVLFFQAEGDTHTNLGLARIDNLGHGRYQLTYTHKIADYPLRPFSTLYLHWELTLANGNVFTSPVETGEYTDTRFAWQTLEEGDYRVHWYQGDLQFGQDIINMEKEALSRIKNILPMPDEWVAGHADPDLGVILVSLPDIPEQKLLASQRIPHELMHTLLYQNSKLGYDHLPVWLKEGLASLAELYPNPDYRILLDNAANHQGLIPLNDLCNVFPREASAALLSYAEAQSFTQYLQHTYGAPGLQSLITTYANGLDCENGARQALGKGLAQLDSNWQRDELRQNSALNGALNFLPWILMLMAVLAAPLLIALLRVRPS